MRVNVATGEMKVAAENPGHVDHWVTDHKGRILAATETDGVNATLLTRPDENAPFKKVLTTSFREHLGPQFYTFDNKELYAASNIGRDKQAIVKIDPATAKETGMIYQNPDVDVEGLAFSKKRKGSALRGYTTWKEERKYLDPQTEKMFMTLEKSFLDSKSTSWTTTMRKTSSSSQRQAIAHRVRVIFTRQRTVS